MAENDASETTRLVESGKSDRVHSSPSYEGVDLDSSSTTVKKGKMAEYKNLSMKRKYILVMCTIAIFLGTCAFSLLGPFYTLEAEKKGMSTFLTGIVFGIFNFVVFLSSPFFGNYLTRIGPKFAYCSGIFVSGVCNILFGTLDKCPSGAPFIAMSIVVRCVEALGFSAFNTAIYAIVSHEFSGNVGFVLGVLGTGSGLAFIVGPSLGGALYTLGGYGLPFYTIGGLVLLNGAMTYKFLQDPENAVKEKREGSMIKLLCSSLVWVALMAVFIGVFAITTLDTTLAKRLEPFGLSPAIISLFFMIDGSIYSAMAMVWGYLSDKKDIQAPLIIVGLFIFGLGYMILGPSGLLPFVPDELWTIVLGLALSGLTLGCLFVPTMKCVIKGASELGFKDSFDTYAIASGLYNSFKTIGGCIGPIASSALVDAYGYPIAFTCIGLLSMLFGFIAIAVFSIRYLRKKKSGVVLEEIINPITKGQSTL